MSALQAEREVPEIVKVSIEVRSGTARFRVAVQAESIKRALSLVGARFPGRQIRVEFPIEAEAFFVGGTSEMVEQPQKLAA